MDRILECVPNFSEGRNEDSIKKIIAAIASVPGIKILHVDTGKSANRTVVTFAGEPAPVMEAAFQGAKKASEVIDMTMQTGEHPRFGALDVCPFIPVSGISMDETVEYAKSLGKRMGEELGYHIYCYAYSAFIKERFDLAYCRAGEYEGLKDKLALPEGKPDFGPLEFNARLGASAVGARDYLVAYNINLNTDSTQIAKKIAAEVREKRKSQKIENDPVKNNEDALYGNATYLSGLKAVKAIGWYIREYGFAQVSMNLTNINMTPLHQAFEQVCQIAEEHGVKVTGSEIIGLVPLKCMLDAGSYFLNKQNLPSQVSDADKIAAAIEFLGLNQLYDFKPEEKILELVLGSTLIT